MDPQERPCLLDSHTPAAVVEMLGGRDDATDELVELIRAAPHRYLKKLRAVFQSVDNYDVAAVVALCQSPNRQHRYTATYLVLSQIKAECRRRANFDRTAHLYESVFTVRFRDVDPLIRGMAVQFVSEFIVENPVLRRAAYLKYVGWALNDRSDSVRRRALRSVARLAAVAGGAGSDKENAGNADAKASAARDDLGAFFLRCRERLIEMACSDANANLQRDAADAVLLLHVAARVFSEDDLGRVLAVGPAATPAKQEVLGVLLPDGVWDMDRIHELYRRVGVEAFRSWRLGTADLEALVLNVSLFVKEHSACCDSPFLCYLDVLGALEMPVDPSIFIPLLEATRDSSANTARVVQCICNVAAPEEFAGSVAEVVAVLHPVAAEDPAVFGPFVRLLRRLEPAFDVLVGDVLAALRSAFRDEYFLPLVKSFDVSALLPRGASSVEKCYAALWLVARGDYARIEALEFGDAEGLDVLVDFLVLFHGHAGVAEDASVEELERASQTVADSRSAFTRLYCRLHGIISGNLRFGDEDSCMHLYKMVSRNIFPDAADMLYRACGNDTLLQLLGMTRHPKAMVAGFLRAVGAAPDRRLHALARQVAGRASAGDSDRYVFGLLKGLVARRELLDTVLLHFVPALTANECIVLESMVPQSRFRAACTRICRTRAAPGPG